MLAPGRGPGTGWRTVIRADDYTMCRSPAAILLELRGTAIIRTAKGRDREVQSER